MKSNAFSTELYAEIIQFVLSSLGSRPQLQRNVCPLIFSRHFLQMALEHFLGLC